MTRLGFDAKQLPLRDWQFVAQEADTARWTDAVGDVITLTRSPDSVPRLSDRASLEQSCRRVSEGEHAGLVEVEVRDVAQGSSLAFVYKRREGSGFTFFGVALVTAPMGSLIWRVECRERGMTGIRESIVTAKLFEAGRLTLDTYVTSWARDPYAPDYAGVDRETLRYLSDDAEYDAAFPNHPLTKTRRQLDRLLALHLPSSSINAE